MILNHQKTRSLTEYLRDTYGVDLRQDGGYHPPWFSEYDLQGIVDEYTLAQSKNWWAGEIQKIAKEKRDKVVAGYSTGEMAAWGIKEAEASNYFDESTSQTSCPMLYLEAQARGVPVSSIKVRVLANAAAFRVIEAGISGHAGKLRDQIMAAADFAVIEDIDITLGWPL